MQLLADRDTIVTASKDKNMKFWYPPESWEKTDGDRVYTKPSKSKSKNSKKSKKKKKKVRTPSSSEDDSSDDEIILRKPTKKKKKTIIPDSSDSDSEYDEDVLARPAKLLSKPVTHVTGKKKQAPTVSRKKRSPSSSPEPVRRKAPVKKIYVDDDSSDEYGNWQD
jgi:hypothetical protein